MIFLNLEDSNINKGKALINNLVEQYNADGIADKNEVTQTTTDFLDFRIDILSEELAAIEGTAEQFKTRNMMVDVNAGADIYLQSSTSNERDCEKVKFKGNSKNMKKVTDFIITS